jgi:hypothetical protein
VCPGGANSAEDIWCPGGANSAEDMRCVLVVQIAQRTFGVSWWCE